MTSGLLHSPSLDVVFIADSDAQDSLTGDWFDRIELLDKLGGLPARAASAHSQRPVSMRFQLVRPALKTATHESWSLIVKEAGGLVERIEAAMRDVEATGMAIWMEAGCSEMLACSYAADRFGGEGSIGEIFFDVTPEAVLRLSDPFGQQVLKRIVAGLQGAGVSPYFVARDTTCEETLHELGVPVVTDPPIAPAPRRAPQNSAQTTNRELDLGQSLNAEEKPGGAQRELRQQVLQLMADRRKGPMTLTVKGSAKQVSRATPLLEDLAALRVSLNIKLSDPENRELLQALNASPILRLAFNSGAPGDAPSTPDVTMLRAVRSCAAPEAWAAHLVRSVHDAVGYSTKEVELRDAALRLDVR